MRLLFVCSMGRMRSRTAAQCIYEFDTDYAGTDSNADRPIIKYQMDWADVIICMEEHHRSKLRRKFKGYSHKIKTLNIPDEYEYMDCYLISLIRAKVLSIASMNNQEATCHTRKVRAAK